MQEGITQTIGMDLGDRKSQVCVLDPDGSIVQETSVSTTRSGMQRFFGERPPCRVVIEAGTHALWVAWGLASQGYEVLVAHPRRLRLIYQNPGKNDRTDARHLAKLGRLDPSLLSPIRPRSEARQQDLARIRGRKVLVASRTQLINHVRGVVKSLGYRVPSCTSERFPTAVVEVVPRDVVELLRPVILALESLTEQIIAADRELKRLAQEAYPETAYLTQVTGVGPITALTFVLTVDDPTRFAKSRTVGAYLGLTPRQDQSGDANPQLGITHAGDPYLRTLLVSCAHLVLRANAPDTNLKRWGLKLAERGGANAKKRAVVAVARKLAVLLHRLWVTQAEYIPVGYGQVRAEAA